MEKENCYTLVFKDKLWRQKMYNFEEVFFSPDKERRALG
jgi:hypothetical protein